MSVREGREVDTRDNGSRDRLTYVGHGTVLIEACGARLLTDPMLRRHMGPLLRRGPLPDPAVYADLDAVLISHLHLDHLDVPSLRLLDRSTTVVIPEHGAEIVRRQGFQDVRSPVPGKIAEIGGVRVEVTPAYHGGKRHPAAREGDAVGYLVGPSATSATPDATVPAALVTPIPATPAATVPAALVAATPTATVSAAPAATGAAGAAGHTFYFAGDTGLFEGMVDLAGRVDVAVLPVAGWGTALPDDHLGPLSAAEALTLLRPRIAIPIHWGVYHSPLLLAARRGRDVEPPLAFVQHAAELAPEVEVRVVEPGESTVI